MNKESIHSGLRTWIEVDRKAIRHNFSVLKSLISKRTKLMAVVKSNAYGHGLVDFSREMEKLGANFLGVDSVVEGLALRRVGIKTPILILGYTLPEMIASAVEADIALSVSHMEGLQAVLATKTSKSPKIHIKVDTGMHRQGFLLGEQKTLIAKLKGQKSKVIIEGLMTHFAAAKNPSFPKDTKNQMVEFKEWISAFHAAGLNPIIHAAATSGTMLFPEAHFDMVRIGIGLYGLWPAEEVGAHLKDQYQLKPVLVWKSFISEIKKLPKGARVGYDLTEAMSDDGAIAVIPIGYWHGYPRALSSIGRVIIGGKECKVVGRVSMDMLTVDVSRVRKVAVGDEVIILGKEGSSPASAEGMAKLINESWYEIITRLNPLIRRLYR